MLQISVSPSHPRTLNFRGSMSFQDRGTDVLRELPNVISDRTTLDLTGISDWDETTVGAMLNEIAATGKRVDFITKDAALCLKLSLVGSPK